MKNKRGNSKINEQSRHVLNRGNNGHGSKRGVNTDFPEEERKNRSYEYRKKYRNDNRAGRYQ